MTMQKDEEVRLKLNADPRPSKEEPMAGPGPVIHGGAGSGNFGHEGRPGELGGSGGAKASEKDKSSQAAAEKILGRKMSKEEVAGRRAVETGIPIERSPAQKNADALGKKAEEIASKVEAGGWPGYNPGHVNLAFRKAEVAYKEAGDKRMEKWAKSEGDYWAERAAESIKKRQGK